MKKLASIESETSRQPRDEHQYERGQWYWLNTGDGDWIGCVTHVGSNYVRFDEPGGPYHRIHFDELGNCNVYQERDPDRVINSEIEKRKKRVSNLLDEIKKLTAKLGLDPAGELGDGTPSSTALTVARGVGDVKAHKKALIKAKEKTLPDLFQKVKEEHKEMATWMKAKLIPMEAETSDLKERTSSINDRIFAVELYAGLCEDVVRIRKGEPAGNDEKIHLFQRRHYMDEECLVNYEAGGMEFKDIRAFDRWLVRKSNRERILPMPKCIVAFQVRREHKERDIGGSLFDFIRLHDLQQMDKATFLYMRNGDNYYRLVTDIEFGPQLFPDQEHSYLMGGKLWISDWGRKVITDAEHNDILAAHEKAMEDYKKKKDAWDKMTEKERKGRCKPWAPSNHDRFEPLDPSTVYYDDGMMEVAKDVQQHNRVAVVLQGILDRSPVFHPHPPWKIWTPAGFAAGIELCHDDSRGMTSGDPPDFEAYRSFVNLGIEEGTNTVGQRHAWMEHEAKKENARKARSSYGRDYYPQRLYVPYGNPGPQLVTPVSSKRGRKCTYRWWRERITYRPWDSTDVPASFSCKTDVLLNVDAYTKGDFKQFYEDPRTRAQYLQWAPLLLAAEDFVSK